MTDHPIRVLIANDSPVERELLLHVLRADPRLQVVATASDGAQAVEAACRERPDVVAMDVYMPKLDGLAATGQIMERCPTRIVMVTASVSYLPEGAKSFRALEMGALALVRTPPGVGHPKHAAAVKELIETITAMSEVKVVHRWATPAGAKPSEPPPGPAPLPEASIRLVAIGASAGGPPAILYLLANLPKDFPVPLLIVQHMATGFIESFAGWLQQVAGFPVRVASQGERLLPGHAYLAPSDSHMGIGPDGRIELSDGPPESGVRPAVSHLFRSVDAVYGRQAVGVLLSGMGADGALELKSMRQHGAITIAQNRASATIYGMPGEAVRLGAVSHELPLEQIPGLLVSLALGGTRSP